MEILISELEYGRKVVPSYASVIIVIEIYSSDAITENGKWNVWDDKRILWIQQNTQGNRET